jgi:hypothetical protein
LRNKNNWPANKTDIRSKTEIGFNNRTDQETEFEFSVNSIVFHCKEITKPIDFFLKVQVMFLSEDGSYVQKSGKRKLVKRPLQCNAIKR